MRKKALPIGVLFMVLVVLLAAVGISYGYWSETILATGTVDTGELNVNWAAPSASISGTPGDADCEAVVDGGDDNHLIVTLSDMHPGAKCTVTARIWNTGTVPVLLDLGDPTCTSGCALDTYLDVPAANCTGGFVVGTGSYRECWATFEMLGTAPNSTMNKSASYSANILASQYVP